MSGDLENLSDYDFSVIKEWKLDIDPFAAIKDYSATKGCVAIKKKDFLILNKLINKKTKIKIT